MRAAALVALVAACAAPRPAATPGPPAMPAPIANPIAAAVPFGAAASVQLYNVADPFSSQGDAAVANDLVARLQVRSSVGRTPKLDAIATELAEVARAAELSPELVQFALNARGVIEPVVATVVARGVPTEQIADNLAAQLEDYQLPAGCYVGIGGANPTVAIVVRELPVDVRPFPRVLPHRGELELTGWANPQLTDLRARFTHEDGHVDEIELPLATDKSFRGRLSCGDRDGANWLLLEASLAGMILLVPVYCGAPPATVYRAEARDNLTTTEVERRIASIVNRERARLGLRPLAPEPRGQRAAERYARAMRDTRRIDHEIGGTVPVQRLRAEGLVAVRVSETTMHVQSLQAAAELLMNDPRFAAQVAQPDNDRLAVAVARNRDDMYITLLYLRVVPPIDASQLTEQALARVKRSPNASESLQVNPDLTRVAMKLAAASAAGWSQETIDKAYAMDRVLVRAANTRTTKLLDPSELDVFPLAPEPPFDRVGIGVAQSSDAGPLAGTIWIVVITRCHAGERFRRRRGSAATCGR